METTSNPIANYPQCTLADVAAATGGTVHGGPPETPVRGIAIDSRDVHPGQLFIALRGERSDGHDFLASVWAKGCSALVHRLPERLEGPCVLVQETLAALQTWATQDLRETPSRICGISGSVGKTSIKELCAAVLSTTFRVHRTRQNRNGQLGVALTILERPPGIEVLVLEMGISLPGEMERLVAMAPLEVAVLSRLSEVHRENFGSFEDLVSEKRRLLVPAPGQAPPHAIVHVETWPRVLPLEATVVPYGFAEKAQIRGLGLKAIPAPTAGPPHGEFQVEGLGPSPVLVRIPFAGLAMAENALAALAVGRQFGVPVEAMQAALADVRLDAPMRQEWHSAGQVIWINDAYNASPASMVAALELLGLIPATGKRIAVLGDMLELGPDSEALHQGLSVPLARVADRLFTFGPRSQALAKAATIAAESHQDIEELCTRVLETVQPGDVVLLKASRGMRLERVAQALARRFEAT